MDGPDRLSPYEQKALTRLLLACGTIRHREQRALVLEDLGIEPLAEDAEEEHTLLAYVADMVTRSGATPGGLSGLVEAIRFYEGDTHAMDALDDWFASLAPAIDPPGPLNDERAPSEPGTGRVKSELEHTGSGPVSGILGALVGVPELPPHYLDREREVAALGLALCQPGGRIVHIRAEQSVHRLGGIGKSVLAAAVARSTRIRARFNHGVYWLTLGREPDIAHLQASLARALGIDQADMHGPGVVSSLHESLVAGKRALTAHLEKERVLLVVDGVYRAEDAAWLDVVGQDGRLLMTSRHGEPSFTAEALEHPLGALSLDESCALLAAWSGCEVATVDDTAAEVADACGRLPLALAMAGALSRIPGSSFSTVLAALTNARLDALRGRVPAYPYRTVYQAIEANLAHLGAPGVAGGAASCYADLAVFDPDETIPLAVLRVLWGRRGLDTTDADALVRAMAESGLGSIHRDGDSFGLRLHQLQHAYARARAGDLVTLHGSFVDALAARCPSGEFGLAFGPRDDLGPPDGSERAYFYRRLPYHLIEAGRGDLLASLFSSYRWLDSKLRAAGMLELMADFDRLPLEPDSEHPLTLVRDALRLSTPVLMTDVDQLSSQLVGRLGHLEGRDATIAALVRDARKQSAHPWLVPIRPNLTPPGGPLLHTFVGHTARVFAVALSGDGSRALSGADDQTARVWDTRTRTVVATLVGHSSWVRAVALSADGRRALTGSEDQTIKFWNADTGELLYTFEGHTWSVRAVALSADGRRALSGSLDQTVKVWDTETGALLRTFDRHTDWITAVALSADGARALSGALDQTAVLWDTRTGARLRVFQGHEAAVNAVALSSDGVFALSGAGDGAVLLWDTRNGAIISRFAGHSGDVFAVALSADGRHALSGSMDQTVRFWDARQSAAIRTFEGHSLWVNAVALSSDGKRALSGSDDQSVKFWDTSRGAHSFDGHVASVLSVAMSADGKRALSGSLDQTIKLWDTESGALVSMFEGHARWVDAVALSADGTRALSGSEDRTVKLWDTERGVLIRTLEGHGARVRAVALSADGQRALSGSDDRTLRLWDTQSGTSLASFEGHTDWVRAVALSADGTRAFSGSDDRTVKLWDPVRGTMAWSIEGHDAEVVAVALSRDGKRALSGSLDRTVKLWDTRRGALLHQFEGHQAEVVAVALSADGKRALSGSLDHTVKLWDTESGRILLTATMDQPILACDLHDAGASVVVVIGDQAGHVHMARGVGL